MEDEEAWRKMFKDAEERYLDSWLVFSSMQGSAASTAFALREEGCASCPLMRKELKLTSNILYLKCIFSKCLLRYPEQRDVKKLK